MRTLVLVLALAASSCTSSAEVEPEEVEPERVEAPLFVAEDDSYRLELPLGWKRSGQELTLDGWDSQVITFNAGPVLEPTQEGAIDPTAPELLQAMQEELAAQPGVQVIDCRAATFDGLPGFRLHLKKDEPASEDSAGEQESVTLEAVICGAVDGHTLYAFSLQARSPQPFARDLPTFERMVASFERTAPASSPPAP